jgi:DNA repair exonuclease SbcCD nuclease subunit
MSNKIALITDLHFGARNASSIIMDHQRKFYKEVFFPYLNNNKIDTVICLGDTFDQRKYTNNIAIDNCKDFFFDQLQIRGIKTYMLVGNHDIPFKHTLFPNTPRLILAEYDNINLIEFPITIDINGIDIAMIPWICNDNYDAAYEVIKGSPADILMGHLEVQGFKMYRGVESKEGLSPALFDRYHKTFSGHYHHRSSKGNITYLGTPYEMTWQDYGDPKGFHIFDLSTRELEFIENPNTLFVKLEYNDLNQEPIDLNSIQIENTYVKLIVVNKTDFYKYDLFLNKLYNKGAHEIKIIEDIGDFANAEISEEVKLEDTQSVLNHYIDSIDTDVDISKIKSYIQSLYTEALNTNDSL